MEKSDTMPRVVQQALASRVVDIGQLTKAEKKALELYCKKRLLMKIACYDYPIPKPCYIQFQRNYFD